MRAETGYTPAELAAALGLDWNRQADAQSLWRHRKRLGLFIAPQGTPAEISPEDFITAWVAWHFVPHTSGRGGYVEFPHTLVMGHHVVRAWAHGALPNYLTLAIEPNAIPVLADTPEGALACPQRDAGSVLVVLPLMPLWKALHRW